MAVRYVEDEAAVDPNGVVAVPFTDTARPDWRIVVNVQRWPSMGPADPDDQPDLWPGPASYTRTAAVGLHFEWLGNGEPRSVQPSWVKSLPLRRITDEAEQIARDLETADADSLPPLPRGYPTKATTREWHAAFLAAIEGPHWRVVGSPMQRYREAARRKRVSVGRVKQWAHKAREYRQQEGPAINTVVAHCERCGDGITPGIAFAWEQSVFHPTCVPPGLKLRDGQMIELDTDGNRRPVDYRRGNT